MLLHKWSRVLTRQEVKTLQGQALAGDVEGAEEGVRTLLRRCGYGNG